MIVKKIKNKIINILTPPSKTVIENANKNETLVFCFLGEFGYELISWIPYIYFLKKSNNFKIHTIGRPGSGIFYSFSDSHTEIGSEFIGDSWGDKILYKKVSKKLNIKKMIHPTNNKTEKQVIKINNSEWTNKNIHKNISLKNYNAIDFLDSNLELPFNHKDKKIIVINNKYNKEWGSDPVNFFSRKNLISLKNELLKRNYYVVYNTFYEPTTSDIYLDLKDKDIFNNSDCFDMREYYNTARNLDKNLMQISLYKKAEFVIGVQGGNVYLPAICRKKILMLMKKGVKKDYTELSRIYRTPIEIFDDSEKIIKKLKKSNDL
jgi:hypothetical protein